jgi:hypothetical protein
MNFQEEIKGVHFYERSNGDEVRRFQARYSGRPFPLNQGAISPREEMEFKSIIAKMRAFEEPDGYAVIGNVVYAIDFYKVDISFSPKKGSENLREQNDSLKGVDSIWEEVKKAGVLPDNIQGIAFNAPYRQTGSLHDYYQSAVLSFKKHVDNIAGYRNRLVEAGILKEGMRFKVIFFLEDVSVGIHVQFGEHPYKNIPLFQIFDFRRFFQSQNDVAMAALCQNNPDNPGNSFLDVIGHDILLQGGYLLFEGVLSFSDYVTTTGGLDK